jgi:glycosyltransferase involved in cell wall biosynthesis
VRELGKGMSSSVSFWLDVKGFAEELSKLIPRTSEVIVTSSFPSALVARFFRREKSVRVLHYFHDPPAVHDKKAFPLRLRLFYEVASSVYARMDSEAVRDSDLTYANSMRSSKIACGIYGINRESVRVVYPGVDIARFTRSYDVPMIVRQYVKDGIPVLFFPKGVCFWRNPEVSLRALSRLSRKRFVALFTGGVDYEVREFRKNIGKLELKERVLWIRELPEKEMNSLYSCSTLVVSIPKREGFGLTALEALSCGTPAIISRESGVSEVLINGEEVASINPADSEELASVIEALISDYDLRERLVENGRRKIASFLNRDRFIQDFTRGLHNLQFS